MRFKKILHKGQKKQEKNEEEERIEEVAFGEWIAIQRDRGTTQLRFDCFIVWIVADIDCIES